MNRKIELLAPAGALAQAEAYLRAGADAVVVGHEQYALRQPGSMELTEIVETIQLAHGMGKKVYVAMNALLHEFAAADLEQYVEGLGAAGADAIVFGDPAVLLAVRKAAPSMRLHWNTETTSTNYRTMNFWAKRGATRAILARELSMEEVLDVKRHTKIEVQVQVHGMTCIFHSKRELVNSYMAHRGEEGKTGRSSGMYLREEKRGVEERYPIYEDAQGTHVMSNQDLCMVTHLRPLIDAGVDSFKIETLLRRIEDNERIIHVYRQAIDTLCADRHTGVNALWVKQLEELQSEGRALGTGFYFKDQIY
jgi:U32 family peptidase